MGEAIGGTLPLAIGVALSLDRLKDRMISNNGVIIAVICVVIAARLIGDGITTLSLF